MPMHLHCIDIQTYVNMLNFFILSTVKHANQQIASPLHDTASTYLERFGSTLYRLREVQLGLSRQQNRMDPWTTDGRDGKKL